MEALSLYELNGLVRRAVEEGVSGSYWVQAELAEVRVNAAGHCYVEFVQKSPQGNALLAKARGVIWSNVYQVLRPYFEEETGQAWAPGIKVLVRVAVAFHELYGFSLVVYDIDPAYTLGDLAQRRRAILKQLADEGVLTLNKELPMPVLPQRVAVVSSPTAAGYGDFCHQLRHNPHGYYFHVELFAAVMQGEQTEDSILAALDAIHARQDEFDVVVIIRGGGATSDLSGFDTYLLAAACAQFPLPIITVLCEAGCRGALCLGCPLAAGGVGRLAQGTGASGDLEAACSGGGLSLCLADAPVAADAAQGFGEGGGSHAGPPAPPAGAVGAASGRCLAP